MKSEIVDIDEIEEVIINFAQGDFTKRMTVSNEQSNRDLIANGINMLGEELERTTISSDHFSSIYNAVQDMLFVVEKDWTITDVNKIALTKFGLASYDIVGESIYRLEELAKIQWGDIISNISEIIGDKIELNGNDYKGDNFPIICTFSNIYDRRKGHTGYLIILKDITQEKELELEKLRAIVAAQEIERARLAKNLHDSLSQELNVVKSYLEAIGDFDPNKLDPKIAFANCKSILNDSINSICDLSFDLMPSSIRVGDLRIALAELQNKLRPIIGFNVSFPDRYPEIAKEKELSIYRIIQEFVQNSIKHANCNMVSVKFGLEENILFVEVKDDGQGFEMDEVEKGNGIENIASRLEVLNARKSWESSSKEGTILKFSFQL